MPQPMHATLLNGVDDFVVGPPTTRGAAVCSVYFGGSAVDPVEDRAYVGDHPGGSIGLSVAAGDAWTGRVHRI
jgi:hypothetical protein